MVRFASPLLFAFILSRTAFAGELPLIHKDTGRVCNPGFFENGNTCQPCSPGTFRNDTNPFICLACPPGFSLGFSGGIHCFPCYDGQYQDEQGAALCKRCPKDFSSNDTLPATKCTPCPEGTYTSTKLGFARGCIACRPGTFYTEAASLPGEEGVPFLEGQGRCKTCPQGTFSTRTGALECERCPPGHFVRDSTKKACQPCPPGTSFHINRGFCRKCAVGYYQPSPAALSCRKCPDGSSSSPSRTACIVTGLGSINGCPAGNGRSPGSGSCDKCSAGHVAPLFGVTECSKCLGLRIPNEEASECVCPPNHYPQYGGDGTPCLRCADGAFGNGKRCNCPPGQYIDSGRNKCACPPKMMWDGSKCVPCAEDALPIEGSGCDFCTDGYGERNNRCDVCYEIYRQDTATFGQCVGCPEDKHFSSRGVDGPCVCNQVDYFNRGIDDPCRKCPAGTGIAYYGSNDCVYCEHIERVFNGTDCVRCDFESEDFFNGKCLPKCSSEKTRNLDTGRCECIGGPEVNGMCRVCGSGRRYSPKSKRCICMWNMFENEEGQCVECAGGTSSTGEECKACGSLRYRMKGQLSGCSPCDEGDPDELFASQCVRKRCTGDEFVGLNGRCMSCPTGTRLLNRTCVDCGEGVSPGGRRAYCSRCTDDSVANEDRNACVPRIEREESAFN